MKLNYNFQPKNFRSKQGWYSRGYLPHFDGGETAQFITFRLFDSLPQEILEKWRGEIFDEKGKIEFRKKVESYLDSGTGSCFLKDRRVAETVQNSLFFYHEKKYNLISWVIMPNHVHCLLLPLKNEELKQLTHSIKSFSAQKANKILERKGQFWQHESFDRYIRNVKHYLSVIKYIEDNPVKAGLCEKAEDWVFSSAYKG
jgi:REP element-mobilizing transposase RayT